MKEILGIVAVFLAIFAYIPYLKGILQGKTKPHAYSWLVWGTTSVLIFFLQLSHDAGPGAWTTATVALLSLTVFGLSLKNGTQYITRVDTLFFVIALIAAILWLIVKQPLLSMILLVACDACAVIPSLRKAWHSPHEESLPLWLINSFRHFLAIFAIQSYSIITVLNPAVWVIMNASMAIVLYTRTHFNKAQN